MMHERKSYNPNIHGNNNEHGNNNGNTANNIVYRDDVNLTTDIANGYYQNGDGNLFMGKSVDLLFSDENKGYVVLRNPQDAEADMVVNTISIANLSGVPVRSNLYINAKICVKGTLRKSNYVAAANTEYKYTDPIGDLYYGRGIKITCGDNINTAVVGEYSTVNLEIDGTVIIKAGDTAVIELSSLSMCDKAKAAVSVSWWQEGNNTDNNDEDDNDDDN